MTKVIIKGKVNYCDDENIKVTGRKQGMLDLSYYSRFGGLQSFHNKKVKITIEED